VPARITAIYGILGLLWVLVSDAWVGAESSWPYLHSIKGSLYVLATAAMLYLLIRRDIRRLQASEEALAESEQQYRTLVESNPSCVVVHADGQVLFVNRKAAELIGPGSTGRDYYEVASRLLSPEDLVVLRQRAYDAVHRNQASPPHEYVLTPSPGRRLVYEVVTVPFRFQGRPAAMSIGRDVTAQRNAVDQLRASEERLRREHQLMTSIMETSPAGIVVVDRQWQVTFANARAGEVLGLSAPELASRTFGFDEWSVADADGRPLSPGDLSLRKVFETGKAVHGAEYQITRHGGQRILVSVNAAPLADDAGKVVRVVATVGDVTDRARAEAERRESQRALATLVSNLPGMVYRRPGGGNWTLEYVSEGCAAVTGYNASDLQFSRRVSYGDLIHPDDRDRVATEVRAAAEQSRSYEVTYRLLPAGGGQRWVWDRGQAIHRPGSGGDVIEGFVTDVTARVHAEETLQRRLESERLVAAVSQRFINLSADELDRGIVEALGSLSEFAGADRCSVFRVSDDGTTFSNTHEWCTPGVEPAMYAVRDIPIANLAWWVERLKSQDQVLVARVGDLPPRAHRVREALEQRGVKALVAVPMFRRGHMVGHIGFDFVRTERQWGPEDVPLLRTFAGIVCSAMDRRDAERDRERLKQQFLQAQKLEAVGTLAGGVAHDFNNLLTGIIGYANLLRSEAPPDSDMHESAEAIESAARRGGQLTAQLLAFARKRPRENVPVDVHEAIEDVVSLLRRTLGENIVLRPNLAAESSLVQGDSAALQQVILNLVVNARDAMPTGGEIRIDTQTVDLSEGDARLRSGLLAGRYCEIVVSDTGLGIPLEIRDRIFEPFFTTKEAGKGTGMGLAMVYGTVRDHGGSVDLQSEVGRGSSFRIYLPVLSGAVARSVGDVRTETIRGRGRVLVVDDEELVREALTDMLTRLGYEVESAGDGDRAVEYYRAQSQRIDVVIVDMVMPSTGGIECYRALRTINPRVRVLLSTGYGLSDEAEQLLADGQVGVVEKPFGLQQLSQAMAAALSDRP
jgi:PAS domain S-box-containing protein